jgi:hypothetical protein
MRTCLVTISDWLPDELPASAGAYGNTSVQSFASAAATSMLDRISNSGEKPMSAKQNPTSSETEVEHTDESIDQHLLRTPDEDGPHDVPDEEVIEKTLPTGPIH